MKKAMILAAGFATRLRPLSFEVPKACLPVLGRPLIYHIFDWLKSYGINEIGINLHHLPNIVKRTALQYHELGLKLYFSHEKDEILLTAGALYPLRDFLVSDGTFVVVNGKIITDIDIEKAYEFHKISGNYATLILVENIRREPFSNVLIDGSGKIVGFEKFSSQDKTKKLYVFTGIHLLEPCILDFVTGAHPLDTVRDLYPSMIEKGLKIGYWIGEGSWYEFSTPERFLNNNLILLNQLSQLNLLSKETVVGRSNLSEIITTGKVSIGNRCWVEKTIFFGNNHVGDDSNLRECIVGPGVKVAEGSVLKRCILTKAEIGTVEHVFESETKCTFF